MIPMQVDPTKRALLVVDAQNEYFTGKLPVTHPRDSLANVLRAMDEAQTSGVPVVVIQHTAPQPDSSVFRKGSREWELHPEIAARPHDELIQKSLPGRYQARIMAARTWHCYCRYLRLHDTDVL
jgi:nicotinamidase-related amidase